MSAERLQALGLVPRLLYTQAEAATLLGICTRKLIEEIEAGRLRYVLVGKRRKFKPTDLEAYIEKQGRGWLEKDGLRPGAKGRRTSTATSRSTVVDFEEALRLTMKTKLRS